MFAFNWAPDSWALCNGAQLSIQQHNALYALFGSTYGGDNKTYFRLPDLQGRVPVHTGVAPDAPYPLGSGGGVGTIALTQATTPAHTHPIQASTQTANLPVPAGHILADTSAGHPLYAPLNTNPAQTTTLINDSLGTTGAGAVHNNMQPSAVINFCVSLQGLYPPRS